MQCRPRWKKTHHIPSGKIHTLEVIGPTDYNNATASMHDVMSATLMKYDTGDIDAVWVAYDAYAQGCYQALRESQRDIPLVSHHTLREQHCRSFRSLYPP